MPIILIGQEIKDYKIRDTTRCIYYTTLAKTKVSHDSIIFPRFLLKNSSKTFEEVLEREYHIYHTSIVHGDYIPSELHCFETEMLHTIQFKYGHDFMINQKKYCDSLDMIGKGYVESKLTNGTANEIIRKNFSYTEELEKDRQLLLVISLKINAEGNASKIEYYIGKMDVVSTLKKINKNDKYFIELEKLIKKFSWKAARLYDRPILSEYNIFINYYHLN